MTIFAQMFKYCRPISVESDRAFRFPGYAHEHVCQNL